MGSYRYCVVDFIRVIRFWVFRSTQCYYCSTLRLFSMSAMISLRSWASFALEAAVGNLSNIKVLSYKAVIIVMVKQITTMSTRRIIRAITVLGDELGVTRTVRGYISGVEPPNKSRLRSSSWDMRSRTCGHYFRLCAQADHRSMNIYIYIYI